MTETIWKKTVTARTTHLCMLCYGIAAEPGQQYTRTTNVSDGRIYDWVECADCTAIARRAWAWFGYNDEGVDFDDCVDWAKDAVNSTDADARTVAVDYLRRTRDSGRVQLSASMLDAISETAPGYDLTRRDAGTCHQQRYALTRGPR